MLLRHDFKQPFLNLTQCNIYITLIWNIYVASSWVEGGIHIVKNSLKKSRIAKEMTQEVLAESAGVTRQTIGLIEKEKYNPTIALCLRLCQVLDKSLDQLFWLEED